MRKLAKSALVFFSLFLVIFVFTNAAYAEGQIAVPDAGITISPVKFEYDIDPGESATDEILIYNATGIDKNLYLKAFPFLPSENGTPIIDKNLDLPYENDPSQWITLSTSQIYVRDMKPDTAIPGRLNFTVNVPENAAPGGYYAVILQSQNPQDPGFDLQESGVSFTPESAALIIINVNGDVKKELSLADFYVKDPYTISNNDPQWGIFGTSIFEYPPVQFVVQIQNSGNTHVRTTGQIFLKSGGEQIASFPFNESKGLVLRESTRTFIDSFPFNWQNLSDQELDKLASDVWGYDEVFWNYKPQGEYKVSELDETVTQFVPLTNENGDAEKYTNTDIRYIDKLPFGQYYAELVVFYENASGEKVTLSDTISFWVLPWKIILLAITVIVLTITIIVYRRKKNNESQQGQTKGSSKK